MQTFSLRPGVTGERLQLPNGLMVVLVQNPKAPSVSVIHWVKGGSMHELRTAADGRGITGIAHLFEHMMFRPLGPGKPDFDSIVQKLGANINANTRNSATVYTSSVGSENLLPLLQAESDRFCNLHVTDDLLDLERKAVESEYQVNHDSNPSYDLWETITRAAFPNHPLEWGVSGFRDDLYTIKAEDCNAFFDRIYRPNNVGLFIVGDINIPQVKEWVMTLYGSWERGQDTALPPPYQGPGKTITTVGHVPSESSAFWVGFRIPYPEPDHRPKNHALDLAHYILFDAPYSIAKRVLIDQKRYVSALVSVNYDYDTAMLKLVAVAMPGIVQSTIQDAILALPDQLKALSDEDFQAYLANYTIGLTEGSLRNHDLADLLALSWGKYGSLDYGLDLINHSLSVSKDDVVQAITPWLVRENMIVATSPAPAPKPSKS